MINLHTTQSCKNHPKTKKQNFSYCIIVHILVWSKNFQQGMKFLCELIDLESDLLNFQGFANVLKWVKEIKEREREREEEVKDNVKFLGDELEVAIKNKKHTDILVMPENNGFWIPT